MDDAKKENESVLVSVIVLTYNQEKYIAQALDSILMQKTNFDFEILVGDDASTDGTQKILQMYQQRYPNIVKVFRREKNLGPTKNAYELFLIAKGKYLASCEGDDYWLSPDKLNIQISFLENHLEFIGCTHLCWLVNEHGQRYKNQHIDWIKKKRIFCLNDFQGIYLPGQTATFVRHNLFLKPNHDYSIFYKGNSIIGDRVTMLIYLLQGKIFQIPNYMSCYRRYGENKEQSVTYQIYSRNFDGLELDYQLNNKLEKYSFSEFGMKIHFMGMRKILFSKAILAILKGNKATGSKLAKQIYFGEKNFFNQMQLIAYCPIYIIKKVILKIINTLLGLGGTVH